MAKISEEKIQAAMHWLRAYLADGDMPPVKLSGEGKDARRYYRLRRNGSVPDAAAPERLSGIGIATLSLAGERLGVTAVRSGPRGGWRWHLAKDADGAPAGMLEIGREQADAEYSRLRALPLPKNEEKGSCGGGAAVNTKSKFQYNSFKQGASASYDTPVRNLSCLIGFGYQFLLLFPKIGEEF